MRRLVSFTKRLGEAVEADDELRSWLTYKVMTWSLAPGLSPSGRGRWSIVIDPAVGEPFLGSWKAYLASQLPSVVLGTHSPSAASERRLRLAVSNEPSG